jgi:phage tail sheath protein FI
MPSALTYPGVYIEEVPSGVRTIGAVATSICGFVDFLGEGPMDTAVEITSMAAFDRVFGGLHRESEASYAIDMFFKNGGSRAYVIRVASADGTNVPAAATVTVRSHPRQGVAQVDALRVIAANEGSWGNALRVRCSRNPDGSFNLTAARYDGTDAAAKPIAVETHLNLSVDAASERHVEKVVNDASALVQVEHLEAGSLPAATGTLGRLTTFDATAIAALHPDDKTFRVSVADPAAGTTPAATHTATLDFDATPENPPPTTPKALRAKLEAAIQAAVDADGATHPLLAGTTVGLVESAAGFRLLVEPNRKAREFTPTLVVDIEADAGSDAAQALGFTGAGISENVQDYVLGTTLDTASKAPGTVGGDGVPPDANALRGTPGENPTGMYALSKIDLFNLLCIPRIAQLPDAEADALVGDALTFCEEERAFLILDIPEGTNTPQEVMDWIDENSAYRHRNAAVYFPRLRIPDRLDEFRLRSIGAASTVAGIYSRTDATRGVWKAPAGLDTRLRGVSELEFKLTDPENGSLNPIAVNAIRTFPIHGPVVWGARTLDGADVAASEWKYISIRRTALMIEESLFRGTKWVVFEPNDEPTWAKIRQNVGAFMMGLFRQGAFQGSTPDRAFYVKCDGETTTANDRNLGVVNIEVGFAPLKPAEFVVIKIQQIPDV